MIRDDLKQKSITALKARDKQTRAMLGGILAKFLEIEKSGSFTEWTEQAQQDVVSKYVKSLKGSMESLPPGELADKYAVELALLEPYLPQLLDEAATRALIEPLAARANGRLGPFMGMVMKAHKGQVDPGTVRRIGQELGLS
jgi:uncharacterized protein